jgi:hypothetical protein
MLSEEATSRENNYHRGWVISAYDSDASGWISVMGWILVMYSRIALR